MRRDAAPAHPEGRGRSMKAVGYVRVSTEDQAREGYGLAAQHQAIRSYCAAQGWELVETYEDAGRSGTSTRGRDGLARLLGDAAAHGFDRVVFWRFDRLARNLRDLLSICDQLEGSGVGVVSIQENIDTGTPSGRMMRNMMGSVAEYERGVIVDRIKVGIKEKAQQGEVVGPLPLGYRRADDGRVVADPVVAPLVEEMFKRYATGKYSLRDLTQWAAKLGLLSTKGNPLDRLSIRKILTNVTYTGQVSYYARRGGGAIGNGKHQAIVDAATFATVQQAREQRRRTEAPHRPFGKEPYPLSRVAVCGYDESPLVGTKASKAGRPYMRCSSAQRRGRRACQQRMVSAEILEAQVAAYIETIQFPPSFVSDVVAELRQRTRPSEDEATERRRTERELDRLKKLFRWGDIDEKEYSRETAPLKRRLAELDRPQIVLDVERAAEALRHMGRSWRSADRSARRGFVSEVFERIVVRDDQIVELAPKPVYATLFALDRRERFNGDGGVIWLPGQDSNLQPIG